MTKWIGRLFWGAVGAAILYFWDPVAGKGRRARLKDQTASEVRGLGDTAVKRARYEAGRVKGLIHEKMPTDRAFYDDHTLLQKVRSEAIGPMGDAVGPVDLRVEDGVVHLTGMSRDRTAEAELVARIKEVAGVRDIRNELIPA